MAYKKGQNLVEISILLVILVVVGVVAYTALGDKINQMFTTSETKYKSFEPFEFGNNKSTINVPTPATPAVNAGSLGGTTDKPVQACNNSLCTIDFGEFVLTGIPDNFQSIVNASGTSGGTEVLAKLIDQIVTQAENLDPPMDPALITQLANQGHTIASAQQVIDQAIGEGGSCRSTSISTVSACLGQSGGANTGANENLKTFGNTLQKLLSAYPTPSPEQQNVLKTIQYLGNQISTAQGNLSGKIDQLKNLSVDQASLDNGTFSAQFNSLNINSSYGTNTHIKSGVICATGHGADTGTNCSSSST